MIGDMAQDGRVTLTCTVQGGEKRLTAALNHLEGIRSVTAQPDTAEDTVTFSLSFEQAALPEKQVFTLCSAMNAPILRMARCEDDLEQVFLKAISE